ncbi:hypothetical protein RYX36_012010 [Vicia faba]
MVSSVTVREIRIRLVIERNCFETAERDLKLSLSLLRDLKINSHKSSGKHEHVAVLFVILLFSRFFAVAVAGAAVFLLFGGFDLVAAATFLLLSITLDFNDAAMLRSEDFCVDDDGIEN